MAHVDDRWFVTRKGADGKTGRVPTARHGKGLRYKVRYIDPLGKERSKSFARKVDADRFRDTVAADVVRGQWMDPALGRTTFREYAETWMAAQAHRPQTARLYRQRLEQHIYPLIGSAELARLRMTGMQAFLTKVERKGLGPNTVRGIHALARTILRAAVADEYIARSPFANIKLPGVQHRRRGQRAKEIATVRAVAEHARRLKALVVTGACTGMRQGELLGFDVDDVNWPRGDEVTVTAQLVYDPELGMWFGPAKTPEGEDRVIPLPAVARDTIAAHLAEHPAVAVTLPWGGPEGEPVTRRLVFTTSTGRPYTRPSLIGQVHNAAARAGVEQLTPHDLRHHYTTELVNAGIPESVVSRWLGHVPAGVTALVYTHVMKAAETRAREVLDGLWTAQGVDAMTETAADLQG